MVCDALAAARAIEKLADCGPLSHEIATARSSGAQEHQISLFFEVPKGILLLTVGAFRRE